MNISNHITKYWNVWSKILITLVVIIFLNLLPSMVTDVNIYGPAIAWIISLYIFWLILGSAVKLENN